MESGVRRIRQTVNLEESDAKYRGSKTTRNEIFGESSGFSLSNGKVGKRSQKVQESEEEKSSGDEEQEENSEDEGLFLNFTSSCTDLILEERTLATGAYEIASAEDEDEDDDDNYGDDMAEEREVAYGSDEGEDGIQTMSASNGNENQKSEAVRSQLQLWESIMRLTIKTHATLRVFNQLPRGDTAKKMAKESNAETKENLEKLRTNIFSIVQGLIEAEEVLGKQGASNSLDEDDEEIESSEDEEDIDKDGEEENIGEDEDEEGEEEDLDNEDEDDSHKEGSSKPKSNGIQNGVATKEHSDKRLHSFQKSLSTREKEFSKTVSEVLTKWDDRTKFAGRKSKNSKDLAVLESSIMKQIERVGFPL